MALSSGLASGGEAGEEDAKKQKYQQICGNLKEGINPEDPEEETSTSGGPLTQPPTIEVSDGGGFAEGDRPRKRKRGHEVGKDMAAKTAKFSDGEVGGEGTSGTSVESSQQLDLKEGSSEGSTTLSYSEEEGRSEAESSELGKEMAQFTLDEALIAEKTLTLDSSSLNLEELPWPGSPLLSDELIPDLVEQLEPYISEALEAKDDSLLEQWIFDPNAPMPLSPLQTSAGEVEEESQKEFIGGDSSFGQLSETAKLLPPGSRPSQDSSGFYESWGQMPYDLHTTGATWESTTQQAQAGISLPSPYPPLPLKYAAKAVSVSPDVGASKEAHGSEAASTSTRDASAGGAVVQLPSPPSGQLNYANHPFYHIPVVPPSVLEGLQQRSHQHLVAGVDLWGLINLARDLLAQQSLSLPDATLLHGCSEALLKHAMTRLTKPVSSMSATLIAYALSVRFLIADTLWCACETLGDIMDKEEWWSRLMENMLTTSDSWSLKAFEQKQGSKKTIRLTVRILNIVHMYKAGERPSPKDVVQIKQLMFCGGKLLPAFRQKLWDSWRQADKSFFEKR
ncbi:hypothetical protein Emed_004278 [Eimeria media]